MDLLRKNMFLDENRFLVYFNKEQINHLTHILLNDNHLIRLESIVNQNEIKGTSLFDSFSDLQMIYYFIHQKTHDDESKNRKEQTKREYLRDLLQFYTYLQAAILNEQHEQLNINEKTSFFKLAAKRHIRSYQRWLAEEVKVNGRIGYKPATRSRKNSVVKLFLTWLYDVDYINYPLAAAFFKSTVRDREKPDRYLSLEEVQQLLTYYKDHPINHAILITLFTTGLRIQEIAKAKWKDVYIDSSVQEGTWYMKVIGKGGKERHARLMKPTVESILRMRKRRGLSTKLDPNDETPVFTTNKGKPYDYKYMSEYVTKIIQKTNFDWLKEKEGPVTPHWARHFFVNHSVIDLGIPIEVVQRTVGHSDKRITEGYLKDYIDKKNDASWQWDESNFFKKNLNS